MGPQSVIGDEFPVRPGQFVDLGMQTTLDVHRAPVDVRVMVLEEDDGLGLLEADGLAERVMQHVAAHAGVVFMDEPDVGPDEASCTRRQFTRYRLSLPHGERGSSRTGFGDPVLSDMVCVANDQALLAVTKQASTAQDRGRKSVSSPTSSSISISSPRRIRSMRPKSSR